MARVELAGKPIVITGASSGIGWSTALACAKAGMPVVVAARREDRLKQLVESITRQGGRALAVKCDVDSADDCRRLIHKAMTAFNGVYAVFANAGYGFERPVHALSDAELEGIVRTNFQGTLNVLRPGLDAMMKRPTSEHRGHLLICSSCVSKIGLPYHSAYSLTKAMQDHIGRAMRLELEEFGVHVSTVHPIGTSTEFFDKVKDLSGGDRVSMQTPESMKQHPDVVARAIVRCLRKPQGEVWTNARMRFSLALITAFPALGDWALRKRLKTKLAELRAAGKGPTPPGNSVQAAAGG
jgi:short-subunit dehydrogenase